VAPEIRLLKEPRVVDDGVATGLSAQLGQVAPPDQVEVATAPLQAPQHVVPIGHPRYPMTDVARGSSRPDGPGPHQEASRYGEPGRAPPECRSRVLRRRARPRWWTTSVGLPSRLHRRVRLRGRSKGLRAPGLWGARPT